MLEDMDQSTTTAEQTEEQSTRASSLTVQGPPQVSETGAPSLNQLVSDVGAMRTQARLLGSDVDETNHDVASLHRDVRDERLAVETRSAAKRSATSLLEDLSERGFSWRDIARMVRVSVPAVKKWRKGDAISGDNRYQLAQLWALCEILDEEVLIEDLATWFDIPLVSSASITPVDLIVGGRPDLVQEHAHENEAPATVLDEFDPDWRLRMSADFETVRAGDGTMSIRSRGIDS